MFRVSAFIKTFVIGCLIFTTASFCYADNLFDDPLFDNGVNNWSAIGYPFEGTAADYHSAPYSGTNSIQTVTDEDYYGFVYQVISISAGEPVYMSGWVKTNFAIGSTARVGIIVEFLDSSDNIIDSVKTEMSGVNDWFEIFTTGYAPAGTVKMRAGAFIFAQQGDSAAVDGLVYVDDMFIDRITGPGDIIVNPGFEFQLSGWTTGAGTYPFGCTTTQQHSGNYSAYDLIDSVSGDYYGFIYQEEDPFTAGTDIYVSAWGKSDIAELSTAKGGLIVQFLDAGNNLISEIKSQIGGRTDWRQLYVEGTAPSGTEKIRIGGFLWAANGDTEAVNGKFYIDDFVADTNPIPTSPPQSDIINGDFENGVNDWGPDPALQLCVPYYTTDQVVHSGSFAAENIIGDTTSQEHWGEIYQEIPYEEGRPAFVTGWVKTDIDPEFSAVGGIHIEFYDDNGELVGSREYAQIGGQTDWMLLYVNSIAPAGTATLKVGGFVWAGEGQGVINGKVYLDDIELSDTPPSDLILNPGFENSLSAWIQDELNFRDMESTGENQHTGEYSAKAIIEDTTASSVDYWSRIYQEFDFSAGQQLYSTLWVKTDIDPTSTATAGLLVEFLDSNGVVIGEMQDDIGGQSGWTYLYVTGTSPTDTVKARVSCFVSCPEVYTPLGGIVYFDDVVASLDALPPPDFPTALINTGFEDGLAVGWLDLYGPPSEPDQFQPHDGAVSAKKTFVVIPDEDYYSTIYQDIYYDSDGTLFPTDTDVYLTAYLKSNIHPGASARAGIMLEAFDDMNESEVIGKDGISAVNDWRQLYVKATIPAGTRKVRVSGFGWAKEDDPYAYLVDTTVKFDDFVYSYDPLPEPPLQTSLLNPDFENGLNEWSIPFKPAFISEDPNPVHSGNYAVGLEIDDVSERNYFGEIRQDVAAGPGKRIIAKVWAKTDIDPLSNAKARLFIYFFDADGKFITMAGSTQLGGQEDWQVLSIVTTSPRNTAYVSFRCSLFALQDDLYAVGGRAYFDEASLTIKSLPGPCLLAGTKITLADGSLKAIEDIKIGEKVLGLSEDGSIVETEVTETFYHPNTEGFLIITTENNKTLKITGNHPVRDGDRYVEAASLKVGDAVSILENKELTPTKIISIMKDNSLVDVYNLEVDKTQNYFAEGCLVHNKMMYILKIDEPNIP